MKNLDLNQLFIDELEDMLGCENQIIQALPKIMKSVSSPELKQALSKTLIASPNLN